jgi:hypothetical protein
MHQIWVFCHAPVRRNGDLLQLLHKQTRKTAEGRTLSSSRGLRWSKNPEVAFPCTVSLWLIRALGCSGLLSARAEVGAIGLCKIVMDVGPAYTVSKARR